MGRGAAFRGTIVTKDPGEQGSPYLELLTGLGVPIAIATRLDRQLTRADRQAQRLSPARRVALFRKFRRAGHKALAAAGARP
jgi:hypothetical protein